MPHRISGHCTEWRCSRSHLWSSHDRHGGSIVGENENLRRWEWLSVVQKCGGRADGADTWIWW